MVPFVDIHDTAMKINDVWVNGNWKLDEMYTVIPDFAKHAISQINPCFVDNLPDVWVWQNSRSGIFTVKEAYEWLLEPLPVNEHENWKWIWQSRLPANIQFFIWQVLHGAIPTREVLQYRRVCNSNLCPRCATEPETIDHCLFWCVDAVSIWRAAGLERCRFSLQYKDLFTWTRRVCETHGTVTLIIMWVVWCARNRFLFDGIRENMHDSVAKIYSLRTFCDSAFDTRLLESARSANIRFVTWLRPAERTVCLNVDGSLLGSMLSAGFGGQVRDDEGAFLGGFYGAEVHPNILYAEIMAVLHGLELCWDKGFRNVVCYSDSLLATSLITEGVSPYHSYANEIHKITQLRSKAWNMTIQHTLREGNKCADHLAKVGANLNTLLVFLSEPPAELMRLLQADARGDTFVRM